MSTGVTTAVGKFVWHEQHSADPKRAQEFYTQLFGWGVEVWKPGEFDYPMISSGGQTHGGFGTVQGDAPSHWLGHVQVESVDETVQKARSAGGTIQAGPIDMPEVGRFAVIVDPQGAVLSAYEPAGEGPQSAGVFVWDELGTSDVEAAKRFYGEVFGWTSREMGPKYGGYTIFQRGESDVGGMMALPEAAASPQWLPYVAVDDVDATAARAKGLGSTLVYEPMDVPEVGRVAVLRDPLGAAFGLFKPAA